jgi:hypothetical protein
MNNVSYNMPFMASKHGFIYSGFDPMGEEDLIMLQTHFAVGGRDLDLEQVEKNVDKLSVVGRLDRSYTAEIWARNEEHSTDKIGGEGSHTYETKNIMARNYGSGDVAFKEHNQEKIWHRNPEGKRVYDVVDYPNTGRSFHVDDFGQTCAGPKGKAKKRLGNGKYVWNKKNAFWVVR